MSNVAFQIKCSSISRNAELCQISQAVSRQTGSPGPQLEVHDYPDSVISSSYVCDTPVVVEVVLYQKV